MTTRCHFFTPLRLLEPLRQPAVAAAAATDHHQPSPMIYGISNKSPLRARGRGQVAASPVGSEVHTVKIRVFATGRCLNMQLLTRPTSSCNIVAFGCDSTRLWNRRGSLDQVDLFRNFAAELRWAMSTRHWTSPRALHFYDRQTRSSLRICRRRQRRHVGCRSLRQ